MTWLEWSVDAACALCCDYKSPSCSWRGPWESHNLVINVAYEAISSLLQLLQLSTSLPKQVIQSYSTEQRFAWSGDLSLCTEKKLLFEINTFKYCCLLFHLVSVHENSLRYMVEVKWDILYSFRKLQISTIYTPVSRSLECLFMGRKV